MTITQDFNNNIHNIWNLKFEEDPTFKFIQRYPEIYTKVPNSKDRIVYLYFNPSFPQNMANPDIYDYPGNFNDVNSLQNIAELDEIARNEHDHFAPGNQFAEENGLDPFHIDIFQSRINAQAIFNPLLGIGGTGIVDLVLNNFDPFLQDQFALLRSYIRQIDPKLIAVFNGKASKLVYLEWIPTNNAPFDQFDEDLGIYWFSESIPIFFSGILTGGRALDVFSRERMFWLMRQTLQNL